MADSAPGRISRGKAVGKGAWRRIDSFRTATRTGEEVGDEETAVRKSARIRACHSWPRALLPSSWRAAVRAAAVLPGPAKARLKHSRKIWAGGMCLGSVGGSWR